MERRSFLFAIIFGLSFILFTWFSSSQKVSTPPPEPAKAVVQTAPSDPNEKFYVIDTPDQQLVFSNIGGALAEINLPFNDVVHQIGFDRTMEADFPSNDSYPQHPYYKPGSPELVTDLQVGGYTPLLRRDLVGPIPVDMPPRLYALNVVSKYPEVGKMVYEVKEFTDRSITFEASQDGRRISKRYTVAEDAPYTIDVEIDLDGDRELLRGLYVTTGVPEVAVIAGSPAPAVKYRMRRGEKAEVNQISLPKQGAPFTLGSLYPEWISNANGFFGVIIDPQEAIGPGFRASYIPGETAPSRLSLLAPQVKKFQPAKLPGYNTYLPLSGATKLRVYAGPYSNAIFATLDRTYRDPATGLSPDYRSAKSFRGIFKFISVPFSKLLYIGLKFFYMITSSWGFSIILLTILLRLALYPLSSWSMRSMRRMQQLSPKVAAIRERHKKDPRKAQVEIMNLYRTERVNPFMGCFPILIQMPFLIGMFDLLKSSFELRGVPFIPGWINDLTMPDVLFSWQTPLFFVGTQFHLLPILLGGVMWLQQRMSNTLPADKSTWTDQQRQQRMMSNVMVFFFAILFYNFPSGLNLYWLSSMLLGILQQWIVNRQLDKKKASSHKRT
jgi:YidC/Oxa1 family membrane protein insertase